MQHLNYSRQLAKQCIEMASAIGINDGLRTYVRSVVDMHRESQKFILPDGGRIFDDSQMRGLDESEQLSLPYKCIALEYECTRQRDDGEVIGLVNGQPAVNTWGSFDAPKRVVYARERDDWIIVTIAVWAKADGNWRLFPQCAIPRKNYITRTPNGDAQITISPADARLPVIDYMDEVMALIGLMNALGCSNVRSVASQPNSHGKAIKSAMPFDTYHVLEIVSNTTAQETGIGHASRSPREHLRRGHIRRLADGRRIWVTATVVGAGAGLGKVGKTYAAGLDTVSKHR